MKRLWLDYETRSLVNIKNSGLDRYAHDPSTEVLMLAWAVDLGEVSLWQPRLGPMPEELRAMMMDPSVQLCAWNYNFEKKISEFVLGIPTEQSRWYDPSVLCAYMSLPIGLGRASEALSIAGKKIHLPPDEGVKLFSVPKKATKKMLAAGKPAYYFKDWDSNPEQWENFCTYCKQDVMAEREVHYAAVAVNSPMTPGEYEAWQLDQRMNSAGVYVDVDFVLKGQKLAKDESDQLLAQMGTITGCENPNSGTQLKEWLKPRKYPYDSLDVEHIEEALKLPFLEPEVRQLLELKQKLGGSAYKKFQSILDRISADGRLRDQFVYHGAHTGRWCVAEGSMIRGKTPSGAVIDKPIEAVLLCDLVWDGDNWVKHEGVVFSGDKETMIYDDIEATPKHVVWVTPTCKTTLAIADNLDLPIWTGTLMPYQIYRILSPSGRFYIGLTKSKLATRWQQHRKKAETKINHPLYNAIRKYGSDSFLVETLDYAPNKSSAQALEMAYIAAADSSNLYNISAGGEADGEAGGHAFWDKLNQDPVARKSYLDKLAEIKKQNDWSDYKMLAQRNAEWRKQNARTAYAQAHRALRMGSKGRPLKHSDNRPLIERLRWKHNRSKACKLSAIKQWESKTPKQRQAIAYKISASAKARFNKLSLDEKRAMTAKGRAVHIANSQKVGV